MSTAEQMPIPEQSWSRARMQRRELGPVLHDLGHQIYDLAEERLPGDTLLLKPPVDGVSLSEFAADSVSYIKKIGLELSDELQPSSYNGLKKVVAANNPAPKEHIGVLGTRTTFFPDASEVLKEALVSGVIIPLQLYRTIKLAECDYASGLEVPPSIRRKLNVTPDDLLEQLCSERFDTMLHQLALGTNGSVGSAAVSSYELRQVGTTALPTVILGHGLVASFEYEAGFVSGFSQSFLDHNKDYKYKVEYIESGGCPVRHATFPALGEIATQHFADLGTPDAQPRNQGQSLITRANLFLVAALEQAMKDAA